MRCLTISPRSWSSRHTKTPGATNSPAEKHYRRCYSKPPWPGLATCTLTHLTELSTSRHLVEDVTDGPYRRCWSASATRLKENITAANPARPLAECYSPAIVRPCWHEYMLQGR